MNKSKFIFQNHIVVLLAVLLALCGCKNRSAKIQLINPIENNELQKLWLADGDAQSDTVVIFCQGGPSNSLDFTPGERTNWRYLPGYEGYYKIFLHQYSTLYPDIFNYNNFTKNEAQKVTEYSVNMIAKTVETFKNKNKKVLLIGHSYGAFLVNHYLSIGENQADKVAVLSSRIDVPKEVYESHLNGVNGFFENGITFIKDSVNRIEKYPVSKRKSYRVKQILKGSLGSIQHSSLMANKNLENVYYFNANMDDRVGEMSVEEVEFLTSKGAKVFQTRYNHSDTFYGLVEAIEAKEINWR